MADDKTIQLAINTIRTLSIDAVQQAKSGHPGTPMALAPLVYTICNRVMRFDPQDPIWPNRIGSCSRTATPRCCSGPCSISPAHRRSMLITKYSVTHRCLSTISVTFVSSTAKPRDTPSIIGFRALRQRPVHWGRVLLRAWEWASPKSGSPIVTTGPALRSSITIFMRFVETAV